MNTQIIPIRIKMTISEVDINIEKGRSAYYQCCVFVLRSVVFFSVFRLKEIDLANLQTRL